MKKIILTVAAVFAFGFANAQEEAKGEGFSKGDVFISGSVGIKSSKQGDDKSTGFEVAPKVGYFVTNNIAVGAKLGYESIKTENAIATTADENTFKVGVFGRYYTTPSSKFSLFGELGAEYWTGKDKIADVKENTFDIAFRPGISYFVSNNFALEATVGKLGYNSAKLDVDGAEARNTFDLNVDFSSITFGVLYKF
ncbi:outer membrane beta-barrel protein [Flavobacterium sp. WV_118_3]|jgi:outer membrane protein|uniref:outer membrane beta-barrel protein n=1 Tax=Flavobacterium sp. WV_118_3 TaxID=3151764 RepID=UPI00321A48E0